MLQFDDISSGAYCSIIFDSLLIMVTIFVNFFTQINGPSIEDFLQSGAQSFSIEGEGQNGIRAQFTFTITKVLIAPSLIINEGEFASYDLPAPGPSSDAFWGPVPVPSLTPTIYDTCCMATHTWVLHTYLLGPKPTHGRSEVNFRWIIFKVIIGIDGWDMPSGGCHWT